MTGKKTVQSLRKSDIIRAISDLIYAESNFPDGFELDIVSVDFSQPGDTFPVTFYLNGTRETEIISDLKQTIGKVYADSRIDEPGFEDIVPFETVITAEILERIKQYAIAGGEVIERLVVCESPTQVITKQKRDTILLPTNDQSMMTRYIMEIKDLQSSLVQPGGLMDKIDNLQKDIAASNAILAESGIMKEATQKGKKK